MNPNLQEILIKFFVQFAEQKTKDIPNYEEKINKFLLEGFKNLIEEDKFKEHEKNESKLFQSPKSNQGNFFNNNLNSHDFNSHERNFVTPIIKKTLTIIVIFIN